MRSIWFLILLGSLITYHCLTTVSGEESEPSTDASQPTFESCKPYVDAALKTGGTAEGDSESQEEGSQEQTTLEDSGQPPDKGESAEGEEASNEGDGEQNDSTAQDGSQETTEGTEEATDSQGGGQSDEDGAASIEEGSENAPASEEATEEQESSETPEGGSEAEADSAQEGDDTGEVDAASEEEEKDQGDTAEASETAEGDGASQEESSENTEGADDQSKESAEEETSQPDSAEQDGGEQQSAETEEETATTEEPATEEEGKSEEDDKSTDGDTAENTGEEAQSDGSNQSDVADEANQPESGESEEGETAQEDTASTEDKASAEAEAGVESKESEQESTEEGGQDGTAAGESEETEGGSEEEEEEEEHGEPYEPRSRDHIIQILGLDDSEQTKTTFSLLDKVTQSTLKELKSTYENAIKPLEQLYKYRDLSNRHFGDPEIFSKPLIVFMGPWSGGKSTIINWLLGIQHEENALRTGADPSPAQFNIMMYGKEPEKLDGTQLAADWTFSGLQKFGQSFLDRLRGQKLPNRLLEKVNIVEIPGILEVRKQVERSFPFNDACQWFIDRADTLFLIYDPAKLDIGPETEAILDQLKGRENQVRIVLNKADTVKPDELMRVQAMLVWNISPLMSSAEPPVLYAASLWDHPLQVESPKSLLLAHENNFLKDIRDGIERRVETRIAAARRFAVRVRNHAKMVDCYLNTYHNHRSFFSDKKKVSTDIIDHPQNYHIYEGLSTLTNISRYDLPDPDSYRDFFRLNSLWDFPTLQSTCSFWRGCPLHKLDIAIAYDLPEILGKFRRQREAILSAKTQSGSSKN